MNANKKIYDYAKSIINRTLSKPKFPVIFLDRDGVINHSYIRNGKPIAPRSLVELKVYKDVVKLNDLRRIGFKIIIISNSKSITFCFECIIEAFGKFFINIRKGCVI